jgi:hypothetical protein
VWLPGGIIAACAHVDTKEAAGAPQLLLYPQYHLDNASLLARMPLNQVSAALCPLWLADRLRCGHSSDSNATKAACTCE